MGRGIVKARTILITGSSSGIGAGIARALIAQKRGHRLVLTARRAEPLEAIASDARTAGCEVHVVPDDLADPDAPARIVEAALSRFGGLDALINTAGLGLPQHFYRSDPAEMARQIRVN